MRLVLYTRGHGTVKRKKSKMVDSEICLESKNQNGSFNPENAFLSVHLKTQNPWLLAWGTHARIWSRTGRTLRVGSRGVAIPTGERLGPWLTKTGFSWAPLRKAPNGKRRRRERLVQPPRAPRTSDTQTGLPGPGFRIQTASVRTIAALLTHTPSCVWKSYPLWTVTEAEEVKPLSRVPLFATPWTAAHQASPSTGFSRQEYGSGLPFSPPEDLPHPGTEPRSPAW